MLPPDGDRDEACKGAGRASSQLALERQGQTIYISQEAKKVSVAEVTETQIVPCSLRNRRGVRVSSRASSLNAPEEMMTDLLRSMTQ